MSNPQWAKTRKCLSTQLPNFAIECDIKNGQENTKGLKYKA